MTQFVAYQNTNPKTNRTYPYLVDIQSNLLDELRTRVVIPLGNVSVLGDNPITKLCPMVEIHNQNYVVLTQQLAAIDKTLLGPEIANLSEHRSDFIAAIDFIISGI